MKWIQGNPKHRKAKCERENRTYIQIDVWNVQITTKNNSTYSFSFLDKNILSLLCLSCLDLKKNGKFVFEVVSPNWTESKRGEDEGGLPVAGSDSLVVTSSSSSREIWRLKMTMLKRREEKRRGWGWVGVLREDEDDDGFQGFLITHNVF